MTDISIYRGDSKTYNINFKDSDGVAIDITGYTIRFTVKENKTDAQGDAIIAKEITSHSDPTNGVTSVSLSTSDTDLTVKDYVYDFEMEDTSGNITTFLEGIFRIKQDITTPD